MTLNMLEDEMKKKSYADGDECHDSITKRTHTTPPNVK